jgi:hypothetical protein
MQVCTDDSADIHTVVQGYRAIDCRATFYHQHLGHACQRQLHKCQYDLRGLCLLDFAAEI